MNKRLPFRIVMLAVGLLALGLYAAGILSPGDASLVGAAGLGGMILDSRLEFCDATALNTGAAGNYLVGNVIDTKGPTTAPNLTVDLEGSELYCVIQVDTAVTSGGAATVQFSLVSDDAAAIATDGSASVHGSSAAIPKATLIAGYLVCAFRLPRGSYERYVGIMQTTGVAALTAGKINAFLTSDPALYRAYADNVG